MKELTLNGQKKTFTDVDNLAALVADLKLEGQRVAIELNRNIIRRAEWQTTPVQDGDTLEIVHFVGGG